MSSGYNRAKLDILRYVKEFGPCTAQEVAEYRGRSESCCSTQLGRFYRWGLLDRYNVSGEGKTYYYTIKWKGLERIGYIEASI